LDNSTLSSLEKQLPLAVSLPDDETFDSYFSAANEAAVEHLKKFLSGGDRPLYLWGASGSGKSHLLHAATAALSARGEAAVYLPLAMADQLSPEMFDGLEQLGLIAIDDLNQIAGDDRWERAVFDLYNRVEEQQGKVKLLIASSATPRSCGFRLPDLCSRLDWGMVIKLQSLDDEQKVQMLMQRAQNRGMKLSDEVARFLLNRMERDMSALTQALATLDRASMVAKRKLTVPFVKKALSL
jgi:DnaA family protein